MKKLFANFEEYLLAVILPLMCLLVFANTVGRYTQTFAIGWAAELSRYLMIWLVFLGASAAAKKNAHFAVGFIFLIVPPRLHRYFRAFILVMTLVFCGALASLGSQYVWRLYLMGQVSPSLGLPMWFMYGSIPLGCLLAAGRSIQFFIDQIQPS